MKKFLNLLFLFWLNSIVFGQINDPFPIECILSNPRIDNNNVNITTNSINCSNTSPYYNINNPNYNYLNDNNNYLYTPQSTDDIIYIKLNFIFLTKPDGTGNFEQNNPEHVQVIDDLVAAMNYRLGNLGTPVVGCAGYGQSNFTDTRIRVIVNKIWKADPAWDFLYTGYLPSQGPTGGNAVLYPPSQYYYYTYLDNDPTIPSGINVVFANNGTIYNEFSNNNFNLTLTDQWAASEFPYYDPITRKLRQFWPNMFNKYLSMKNFVVGNPTWGSQPWSVVRGWYIGMGYKTFPHELGHSLGLGHQDCASNIMYSAGGNLDYLTIMNISKMYKSASITSVRQYFTENSFKNASINVNNNQVWDLNFRHYSNVKIDNNSSLKVTCKLIMAPESRVIVRNGSNFIIEGAEISSANNANWNGIKVEGNGYCLISPDTKIDNGYFYVYSDNSFYSGAKSSNIKKNIPISNTNIIRNNDLKEVTIYPNPTGDYINISSQEKILSIEIYDLSGKKIDLKISNFQKIDVQKLPQGSYVLQVNFKISSITKKFIKK